VALLWHSVVTLLHVLHSVKQCYIFLHSVTHCYIVLHNATECWQCYIVLHTLTPPLTPPCYIVLHTLTLPLTPQCYIVLHTLTLTPPLPLHKDSVTLVTLLPEHPKSCIIWFEYLSETCTLLYFKTRNTSSIEFVLPGNNHWHTSQVGLKLVNLPHPVHLLNFIYAS
jgi:hypothetical protein